MYPLNIVHACHKLYVDVSVLILHSKYFRIYEWYQYVSCIYMIYAAYASKYNHTLHMTREDFARHLVVEAPRRRHVVGPGKSPPTRSGQATNAAGVVAGSGMGKYQRKT